MHSPPVNDDVTDSLASPALLELLPTPDDPEARRVRALLAARLFDEPAAPVRIGRFTILERIAEGGMGVVYAAYDTTLDRKIAIKVLRRELNAQREHPRIVREAQAMAKLNHPNVAQVFEVGEHEGRTFVAMEFVRGKTLRAWQDAIRPATSEILAMYQQAGRGLAVAHDAGLVHRDFKPDNAIVGDDGRVRVLDFGLVRTGTAETTAELDLRAVAESAEDDAPLATPLTRAGAVIGTPAYMAPEQLLGEPVDARADQFAFCVTLWEALANERPFAGTTRAALLDNVLTARFRGRVRAMPAWIRAALTRGLAAAPSDRFVSMDALLAALVRDPSHRRRRRIATGAVVLTIALAAGGWLVDRQRRKTACREAGASIAEVWNDAAEHAVHTGLQQSGSEYAGAAWTRIQPKLHAFAQTWASVREASCLAAEVEHTRSPDLADRTTKCLIEQREAFAAFVDELSHADPGVVIASVGALTRPEELGDCTDEVKLVRRIEPPSPAIEDRVSALRRRLAGAESVAATGRYPHALELANAIVTEADALGWRPLQAEALLSTAGMALRSGDPKTAGPLAQRAIDLALRIGHDDVAAAAATTQISIASRNGDWSRGLWWADIAFGLAERAGDADSRRRAQILFGVGSLHNRRGAHQEAAEIFEQALTLFEASVGPDHPNYATTLNALAGAHRVLDRLDESRQLHERALAIRERTLGPDHPNVAMSLHNLALVIVEQGETHEAVALERRSVAIREAAFGSEHPEVAVGLENQAHIHERIGEYAQAEPLYERALTILDRTPGPDDPKYASSLARSAALYMSMGAHDEARARYDRASTIVERARGPEHFETARILQYYAIARYEAEDYDHALELAERAMAIYERALGSDDHHVHFALVNLADILAAKGDNDRARELFERSLALIEDEHGRDHADNVDPLAGLAEVALAEHRGADAATLAERAFTLKMRRWAPPRERARVSFLLARALAGSGGDRARVDALVDQARADFRDANDAKGLAKIDAWSNARGDDASDVP